ncbi:Actin-related protein 4 [Tetrabaena socialis]|uniref:Actin-related protein 4 n=1 Tax=Tetrabaena socialis TaxID=47790 RepID=A0A2J7ZZI5_9CHLO|nr:Actin-related protein 4 [Tetrabaena socialis]|eukprot:PNH05679.1 Actin-related protein 4 [Tetrabaena socialis]
MGEVFFQPGLLNTFGGLTAPPDARSLQEVVLETINKCDVDVRKDMFSSAMLTGGTSLVPGLRERLEKELSELVPPAAKVKIVAPVNQIERRFSVWIGCNRGQAFGDDVDDGDALSNKEAPRGGYLTVAQVRAAPPCGSILATLGTFQQLWMSKKEYAEHGAPLINRKCP